MQSLITNDDCDEEVTYQKDGDEEKGFIIVMMKIICKGSFFYGEDGNEYK